MIYRSRYLDRVLFSPLGYRQSARLPHAKRTRPQAQLQVQPDAQARSEEPTGRYSQGQQPDYQHGHQPVLQPGTEQQPQINRQTGHLGERASYLSSRELRLIVGRCEETIKTGRAQIEDYEAFVICQQELSSRA